MNEWLYEISLKRDQNGVPYCPCVVAFIVVLAFVIIIGWCNNYMGLSRGRLGLGVQRGVHPECTRWLHPCSGETEETKPLWWSHPQLVFGKRGREACVVCRQHHIAEEEGGCLSLHCPQVYISVVWSPLCKIMKASLGKDI